MENRESWFYYAGRWLMWLFLRLLTHWEVKGSGNVPPEGSLLIVANHMSHADPPLIGVSVPRRIVFMAKEELFKSRIIGYFVHSYGAFPVRRGQIDRAALRRAKEVLASGRGLVMFPEGMRSRNGGLREAFPGSALIAARNDVLILPIGITGTEKMRGILWFFKRPRITVNIGKPFTLRPSNGRVTKEKLGSLTDEVMCRIAELLPVEYHGCYAEKVLGK